LEELALFINRATGRGGLGGLEILDKQAGILSAFFFSPRLLAGRLLTPMSIVHPNASNKVRMMAAKDIVAFAGTATMILTLLKANGVDVETDWRKPTVGKIRDGATVLDFFGGFQPLYRVTQQMITGDRKNEQDDIVDIDRIQVMMNFGRTKAAPLPSYMINILTGGENIIGEDVRVDSGEDALEQAYRNFAPLMYQDMEEAIMEGGLRGGAVAATSFAGVNVNTYTTNMASARDMFNVAKNERVEKYHMKVVSAFDDRPDEI